MSTKQIRVLLADNHIMTQMGIRAILAQAADIVVVGEAQNGNQVWSLIPKLHPHVLLLELQMPGSSPVKIERWIREQYPDIVTLVLTAHDRDAYLAAMVTAGVSGYLTKDIAPHNLLAAIRRAVQGEAIFTYAQLKRIRRWRETIEECQARLTVRESEVLIIVTQGKTNKEIAKTLYITEKTVEKHIGNLFRKVRVKSRAKLILWSIESRSDDLR